MRSLALIALGTFVASAGLTGQSLAEHAAAAAGATVGTAAGKPLGTALGQIFGSMDNSTSKAAGAKVIKPVEPRAEITTSAPALAPGPPLLSGGSGESAGSGSGSGAGRSASASNRRAARRREQRAAAAELPDSAPVGQAPITPIVVEPVVKEPSVEEIAAVQVGATAKDLEATLGPPESRVSIPDDDGHLLEICQYWSKGQALGTVRLDNGRVVSVQTRSY
jgi:hypothetical protein